MNDSRDELDSRIDAALRRTFALPPSVDGLAARLRPRAPAARLGPALAFAAAAVLVLGLGLWQWSDAHRAPRPPRTRVAAHELVLPVELQAEFPACHLLASPEGAPRASSLAQSPDLVRLYRDMDACQRGAPTDACEDDEALARHLLELDLRPGAAELAHGPFVSEEWPTGQILTMTIEDQTVAVVVERGATLDCCVHPRLAEDSGLHCFTWTRGDLVLAEITPHAEPRMIEYLE